MATYLAAKTQWTLCCISIEMCFIQTDQRGSSPPPGCDALQHQLYIWSQKWEAHIFVEFLSPCRASLKLLLTALSLSGWWCLGTSAPWRRRTCGPWTQRTSPTAWSHSCCAAGLQSATKSRGQRERELRAFGLETEERVLNPQKMFLQTLSQLLLLLDQRVFMLQERRLEGILLK